MLKVILAKIGISLFHCLPLEKTVARLLTSDIRTLPASRRVTGLVARLRKTVNHRNELTALIRPRLDGRIRPDALKCGFPAGFPHFFNRSEIEYSVFRTKGSELRLAVSGGGGVCNRCHIPGRGRSGRSWTGCVV